MTRSERKEKARIRCEERVNGYKLSARKYVDQMSPTLERGARHIQECARYEIRKTPQMKDEIERCQAQSVSWFLEEYAGKLYSESPMDLNEDQIRNWRKVLVTMGLGPWALIMPDEDVEKIANNIQKRINEQDREDQ